ncbi:hypothetical protein KPSB59_1660038 [Klebsiella quasipneumoniae subsp. quasipneumoniae]|nr:hypothetical protein KPSB59_1660038 [Klebsiella quasipneumoniae subsp. quasipneumoniae]
MQESHKGGRILSAVRIKDVVALKHKPFHNPYFSPVKSICSGITVLLVTLYFALTLLRRYSLIVLTF